MASCINCAKLQVELNAMAARALKAEDELKEMNLRALKAEEVFKKIFVSFIFSFYFQPSKKKKKRNRGRVLLNFKKFLLKLTKFLEE